jgi:hypothetical protein
MPLPPRNFTKIGPTEGQLTFAASLVGRSLPKPG